LKRRSILRCLSAVVLAWILLVCPVQGQTLELRFFDVGQGDAALIVTPEGKRVLVDAGPGPSPVVPYLQSHHFDTLDLIVASHNHTDHIGGMADVIASRVVRTYLDNGIPHTTATYQRTLRAVEASGAQYLQATARTITVGSARLRVLVPPSRPVDQNNGSVGVLLEYGEFRVLLTGDSEQYELGYWLQHDSVPRVTVVKVAHHGSRNGTTAAWVQATRPQVAVISVGAGNSYGHPSPQVIEQWRSAGARVYRTDRDGAVIVEANRDGSYIVLNEYSGPTGVAPAPGPTARQNGSSNEPSRACCRVCTRGKACGNSCINRGYQCRQPTGCACDARP
jgi:beta-lactamase superfamily II metal-dependent hydrolase